MTFLAPWALAVGAIGAAGLVLLHLVALQRPAAYVLPTTRFIPDQRTLVSRAAARPRDLLLLALRVLMLLAAAAAFARPVLMPSRGARSRVILLDRSRAVQDAGAAVARARALASDGTPYTLIAFDSVAHVVSPAAWDSLALAARSEAHGSVSAALVAARRASVPLAQRSDSVELILVSPVAESELDAATAQVRAAWPGAIRLERMAVRADSSPAWQLEKPLSTDDVLGPAMAALRGQQGARVTRLVRTPVSSADSAFARVGGTVVHWDTASTPRVAAEGLAVGDDVIVASLARLPMQSGGRVIARWADGTPAATEQSLGTGCIRAIGVGIPVAGDLPLRASFQRMVRGLLAPCGSLMAEHVAEARDVQSLTGTGSAASADVLRKGSELPSPLARWVLGLALLLALAELVARATLRAEVA